MFSTDISGFIDLSHMYQPPDASLVVIIQLTLLLAMQGKVAWARNERWHGQFCG